MQLHQLPLFQRLESSKNILLAGAGGGFDIYSGIPLYSSLKAQGKTVHLANLSFVWLEDTTAIQLYPHCHLVTQHHIKTALPNYFPEKYLCEFLASKGIDEKVFCFDRVGAKPLKEAYQFLVKKLDIDTIILIDGGTDSLMFGDEDGLGTPVEDIASMKAAFECNVTQKFLVCLGFGVDHYHGVSHYRFLENVNALSKINGYFGVIQLLQQMEATQLFLEAVEYTNQQMPTHPSIVANSIASVLENQYGNYHKTTRTKGSELWINPIMSMYWCFDLNKVMELNQYHHLLNNTITVGDINQQLYHYRSQLNQLRGKKNLPI